jgi:hypothetical protein
MTLDIQNFPIVRVSETPSSTLTLEKQLEMLLDREEKFVLIIPNIPEKEEHETLTSAEKKHRALWIKQNRTRLKQWCVGGIMIARSSALRLTLKPLLYSASKVFGFPVYLVESEELAKIEIQRLLAGN